MLSQLLEDYKDADTEDKRQYVDEFKRLIWESKYTYKAQKKYINFKLNESSLNYDKELIELFKPYQTTELILCKSFYTNKLKPADYIRIRINNMYGYLTKPEVYLSKEYYKLLLYPKDEYYETVEKIKNGVYINVILSKEKIDKSRLLAEEVKKKRLEKKINISWKEYKKLINTYIDRLFENYTPLHEYESTHGWKMEVDSDDWSEDNYVVRYFCKSLTGYMKNYVKSLNKVEKRCSMCDIKIYGGNKLKYCKECKETILKNQWAKASKKYKLKVQEKKVIQ